MSEDNGPQSGSIPAGGSSPVDFSRRRPRRPRRSDAERNRRKALDAARRLVAERGLASVTMDEVAAAAGVGKGTLYRGFGTRGGLAEALVDDAERDLQERILDGPPPLGPGAAPGERLVAFADAYVELLAANADLLLETERGRPGARFHTGAYGLWHAHVAALLRDLDHPDAALRAHMLLAPLSADVYQHLDHDLETQDVAERDRPGVVRATLTDLVAAVVAAPPRAR